MNPRQRVLAALRGDAVDRLPVSFWGHAYDREQNARDLVDATVAFQATHGWDWVKLNPRKHYHVEPWGVRYRYPGGNVKPVMVDRPVHGADDWRSITERPLAGALAEQVEAVRLARAALPADVPLIATVFTPLAILGEMVDEPTTLARHLREHPERVRPALEAVTRTFASLARELMAAGAEGLFLATVDWASRDLLTPEEYAVWGRPYDLRLLEAAGPAPFHVLHVCKRHNLLLELSDYPVQAFSWAATDSTNPSLADALVRVRGAVMGGIDQDAELQQRDPAAAIAAFRRGLEQTGGRRWLVAPGCSIPPSTPVANLTAVRAAVEQARPAPEHAP